MKHDLSITDEHQTKELLLARKENNCLSPGFTLLEILIILLILGIVTTIGLPTMNAALEDSRLAGAADEIVTALEYAQLTAMSSGGRTRVTVNEVTNTVLLEQFRPGVDLMTGGSELDEGDVEGGSFVTMAHPTSKGKDYTLNLGDEDRLSGVDITSVAFGAQDFVTFDPLGAPSSGGTMALACGAQVINLVLAPLNGKVSLSN